MKTVRKPFFVPAVLLFCALLFLPRASCAEITLNAAEEDIAARFCAAEARGEPMLCQMGVAAALFNRLTDSRYPDTLSGNLTTAGFAMSPVKPKEYEYALWAVRCAAAGMDPTGGATEWARAGTPAAARLTVTLKAGNMVFGRDG